MWDITSGECILTINGHSNGVLCMKLLTNNRLASGSHDNTIKIFSFSNLKFECTKTLSGHTKWILVLEVTTKDFLISCSGDKSIKGKIYLLFAFFFYNFLLKNIKKFGI